MRILKWVLILLGLLVVAAGVWFAFNFIFEDDPERLTLENRDEELAEGSTTAGEGNSDATSAPVAAEGVDGTWTVTAGSEAGYRAEEQLFGQEAVAVGRTEDVTGSIEISGTTVNSGSFAVDMTTIESDQSNRDNQFRGRIMSVDEFPTSTFALTGPLDFSEIPADGTTINVTATGELTLRGVTNSVTFDVEARLNGANIEIAGAIPVHFDDYEIPEPSGGPAAVGDDGEVEFILVLARS